MFHMISSLRQLATLRRLQTDEQGATAVEYGIMVALIAAVIILVVTALGIDVLNAFNVIEDNLFGSQA